MASVRREGTLGSDFEYVSHTKGFGPHFVNNDHWGSKTKKNIR